MQRLTATLMCALALLLSAAQPMAASQEAGTMAHYWKKFPHPKTLYVTCDVDQMPKIEGAQDQGGCWGLMTMTLQSAAGLAARSVGQGESSAMVWLDMPKNDSMNMWREQVVQGTGAQLVHEADPWVILRALIQNGVIKGYVLYRADRSERDVYGEAPQEVAGYDDSINVATTAAPWLGAILVEESAEGAFKDLGLDCLLDVRGKDQRWAFEQYKDRAARDLIHLIDPKVMHARAYSIATGSLCLYGTEPFMEEVLEWLEPNSPVIGWNAGDEYKQTSQISRHAQFQTASNWCVNLPVMSTLRAGEDIPWSALDINRRSRIDPLNLAWEEGKHYTSFVMSDGDNLQWALGSFFTNSRSYWAAPSRTTFPIGWTIPAVSMAQVCPASLRYMAATASPNDQSILLGGGYYYPEEYGTSRTLSVDYLAEHIDQLAQAIARTGIRVVAFNNFNWKSEKALAAYEQFAQKVPDLVAIFTIQYSPYTAGQGEILWVRNAQGDPIPVISARYSIWNHATQFENNGTPAFVASKINEAPRQGEQTSPACFDWTIVHVWSYFQEVAQSPDLWAEEVEQDQYKRPEVARGVEPTAWCARRLDSHVQVVTPEELAWRVRLTQQPRPTLAALARQVRAALPASDLLERQLTQYGQWLQDAPLETTAQQLEAYERLQSIYTGRLNGPGAVIY